MYWPAKLPWNLRPDAISLKVSETRFGTSPVTSRHLPVHPGSANSAIPSDASQLRVDVGVGVGVDVGVLVGVGVGVAVAVGVLVGVGVGVAVAVGVLVSVAVGVAVGVEVGLGVGVGVDPSPMAYNFPLREPTYIVPSAPIDGDEVIVSPTVCFHLRVPSLLRA